MKKLLLTALCMCFIMPAQAAAIDFSGIYVAPKFVYSFVGTDMETWDSTTTINLGSFDDHLFGGALAVGYDFNSRFDFSLRTELEYSIFSKFDTTHARELTVSGTSMGIFDLTARINVQTLFVNAYYDFRNTTKFTPYVGVGLGLAFVGTDFDAIDVDGDDITSGGKDTKTNFAWNVGLGCSYAFTDRISLDLSYRYAQFGKGEIKEDDLETDTLGAHQALLGVRFTF